MSAKETQRRTKKEQSNPKSSVDSYAGLAVDEKKRKQLAAVERALKLGASVHDSYFHFMLKDPAFLADFLGEYLPKEILEALDLSDPSKIKFLSTDFYDERGVKHIADLLFTVPCKEENEYVALKLLVEHKAQSGASLDRKTIAQTLKYVALEVDGELKNPEEGAGSDAAATICQPLVVLFYTGSNPSFEAPSWERSFPLPSSLRVDELREAQVRFKPITVNLTRMYLENRISRNGFLNVMVASMASASLKRLPENYSTLFSALEQVENWTPADDERLKASVNYVVSATNRPMTHRELESLRLSVKNKKAEKSMKTILDALRDEGKIEGMREGKIKGKIEGEREGMRKGKIEGEIKTIKTVVFMEFEAIPWLRLKDVRF